MMIMKFLKRTIFAALMAFIASLLAIVLLIQIDNGVSRPVDVSSPFYEEIDLLIKEGRNGMSMDKADRLDELFVLHNQIVSEKLRKAHSINFEMVKEQWNRNLRLVSLFFIITFIIISFFQFRKQKEIEGQV